jgi:hypothetical protein
LLLWLVMCKNSMVSFWLPLQTEQDLGIDTGLSGRDGIGPLHHSPETCRSRHCSFRLSLGLLFSRAGSC